MKTRWAGLGLLCVGVVAAFAGEKGKRSSELSVPELESRLLSEDAEVAYVHGLKERAKKGDKAAVPALRSLFGRVKSAEIKRVIASTLFQLGTKEDEYWKVIEAVARARVESDMPTPTAHDAEGRMIRGQFSKEFLAWCKARGLDPEVVTSDALYQSQNDIVTLIETNDPRAIPLLLKGLRSPNHLVVVKSAQGLVQFQHSDGIEAIIAACERLPKLIAADVAQYLVFYKDKRAQQAAERFVTNKTTLERMRRRASKYGPDEVLRF